MKGSTDTTAISVRQFNIKIKTEPCSQVSVKQLNPKFNYFTASVRRGWLNKVSDTWFDNRVSLLFYVIGGTYNARSELYSLR